jgi:hypothetical protein
MTDVQTELSTLEQRHVSFVENIITSIESVERRLCISQSASIGADREAGDGEGGDDWGDENTLYEKLALANDLSAFYYNSFLHLLGKIMPSLL